MSVSNLKINNTEYADYAITSPLIANPTEPVRIGTYKNDKLCCLDIEMPIITSVVGNTYLDVTFPANYFTSRGMKLNTIKDDLSLASIDAAGVPAATAIKIVLNMTNDTTSGSILQFFDGLSPTGLLNWALSLEINQHSFFFIVE